MDALFLPVADAVGASVDQLKIIFCLLVAYPLGSLFVRIPSSSPALKHAFSLAVSLFFFIPLLKLPWGFAQLSADVLVTWLLVKADKSKRMPWIVFFLLMGHLLTNHTIRALNQWSYETFEVTGSQMILVMKLTTFAWNVYDGRRPSEELDKWQAEKKVVEYPSLLAFLGYSFYFPGILVGPYLTFSSYMSLVDGSLFQSVDKRDAAQADGQSRQPLPPKGKSLDEKVTRLEAEADRAVVRAVPSGRKRVAYRKMVQGLALLGVYVVFGPSWGFSSALQPWFVEKSLLYRIAYFQVCGVVERCKYYALWTLTEGAAILTGLGFTGYNAEGKSTWDGAANINIWFIEVPPNFKVLLDNWNMNTNVWLRECVYKRVTPKGKKPGFSSTMMTFATSAIWHGVAAGYYLTFTLGGFIQSAGRLCRANIRPLVLPVPAPAPVDAKASPANGKAKGKTAPPTPTLLSRLYDVAGTICCLLLLNFAAGPFMLSTWRDSVTAWNRLGWYGLWMLAVSLGFFHLGGAGFLKGLQAKRVKAAAAAAGGAGRNGAVKQEL